MTKGEVQGMFGILVLILAVQCVILVVAIRTYQINLAQSTKSKVKEDDQRYYGHYMTPKFDVRPNSVVEL